MSRLIRKFMVAGFLWTALFVPGEEAVAYSCSANLSCFQLLPQTLCTQDYEGCCSALESHCMSGCDSCFGTPMWSTGPCDRNVGPDEDLCMVECDCLIPLK